MSFWKENRFVITGGSGFLGSKVVTKLQTLGATQITVPRSKNYDLREHEAVAGGRKKICQHRDCLRIS